MDRDQFIYQLEKHGVVDQKSFLLPINILEDFTKPLSSIFGTILADELVVGVLRGLQDAAQSSGDEAINFTVTHSLTACAVASIFTENNSQKT